MTISQILMQLGGNVTKKICQIFDQDSLELLARTTGFIKRSTTKITGSDFIQLLTVEIAHEPSISYDGLCDRLKEINPNADITPQALEQRVNSAGAPRFLEAVLRNTVKEAMNTHSQTIDSELLPFNRVFLEDSTICQLNEKLADEFKGSGGSASKAGVKIHLIYDYKNSETHHLEIGKASDSDQSKSEAILEHINSNDLIVRDLGFFDIKNFAAIHQKDAFFLSRLFKPAHVYLDGADEPLDLPKHLNKKFPDDNIVELDVLLGKNEKLSCRLVVYRCSEDVANERKRKAIKNAKKKGRAASQEHLRWLEFTFFVTNVSQDVWTTSVVGTVYRIRWQIEIVFKNWKSLLHIDVLKGTRYERIKCLLYGRMIAMLVINMLRNCADNFATGVQRELSVDKFMKWIKRKDRLSLHVRSSQILELITKISDSIFRFCKQKRNRQTTQQLVDQQIDFMDSFQSVSIG